MYTGTVPISAGPSVKPGGGKVAERPDGLVAIARSLWGVGPVNARAAANKTNRYMDQGKAESS